MSFDEKIFGWAYSKLNGGLAEKNQLQSNWVARTEHIQLVGSSLIGIPLEIKTNERLLCSQIDRIYFPPLKSFPIDLAEAFLWLKVLFHTAAVKTESFWLGNANGLVENIVRAGAEWDQIISSAAKNLPRIKERTEELSTKILENVSIHSKVWESFRSLDAPKTFGIQVQLALPSLPLRVRSAPRAKSTSRSKSDFKMAKPHTNRPVKLAAEAEAEIENVELSENGENPLVHVFEKVLTAENYKGGSRREDGSDEMEDHSNALKDLKVDKLTRSSEETHSQISTDLEIESTGDFADGEEDSWFSLSYPEWFESEQKFRGDWCRLKENTPKSSQVEDAVSIASMVSSSPIAFQLKSELETIFHQAKWKNRQREGSEIDLDAIVRYRSEPRKSSVGAERIFMRREKLIQDFALLLLLDISASTDAWVANRRVLDELRSVVGILSFVFDGDPQKIGVSSFSSDSRLRCSYNWLKHFDEDWQPSLSRISSMEPHGYTRMGVALRHSEKRLLAIPARRRAILLLTDAKPTDFDRYEGKHGRADVRKSIEELEASDIRFLSLAFSEKRDRSFSDLFGNNRCEVVQTADQIGRSFVGEFIALIRA